MGDCLRFTREVDEKNLGVADKDAIVIENGKIARGVICPANRTKKVPTSFRIIAVRNPRVRA